MPLFALKKKNLSGKMEERDRKIKEAEDEAVAVVQVTGDPQMGRCAVELTKQMDLRNGNKGELTRYGDRVENYPQLGVGEAPFAKTGDVERGRLQPTSP